jgi:dolichol kinase
MTYGEKEIHIAIENYQTKATPFTINNQKPTIIKSGEIPHKNINLEIDPDNIDKKKIENNSILDFLCNNSYKLFIINSLILFIYGIILTSLTIVYNEDLDKYFWINQAIKYSIISLIQYLMALLVKYKNVRVNYTRKVVHISYFLLPQLLDILLIKYEKNKFTEFWNVWVILFLLILLSEHIRKRVGIIDTMFKAVDRPEDRPYTLIWFSSQIVATLIVIIPFSVHFSRINKIGLVFIPILINGLADGLAEPVGIRFGRHKYKTRACLSSREYERSYEGSLCVFIVSLIIVLSYYGYITLYQYIFCALTIPILITLTEAFSPHTWDSPCIFFVVCSLLCISELIP